MADYAKTIDEKSEELLQAYKDAETEDEKSKAKKAYIRFYRKLVKSKEFVSLSAAVANVTAAPTAEEFNALLKSLRDAGILATE